MLPCSMATEEEPLYTEEDVMRHAEEQEKSGREAQQWFVFKCVFLMLFILGVLLMAYPVYRVSGKTKMHYTI